jgi:hypothetical protein
MCVGILREFDGLNKIKNKQIRNPHATKANTTNIHYISNNYLSDTKVL